MKDIIIDFISPLLLDIDSALQVPLTRRDQPLK